MSSNTMNRKIAELEKLQVVRHMNDAMERLQAQFDECLEADDEYFSARDLIEKTNLLLGERRTRNYDTGIDKRHQS